jgi:hypothetical protein
MKILFWGLFIFSLAFFIHLVIWKIRIPKAQTKLLLKIFLLALAMSLFLLWFVSSLDAEFAIYAPRGLSSYFHIGLLVISLALVYIATYSAIEADSPSLVMVMNIAKGGLKGLNKEELLESFTNEALISPRIRDLMNAKLIYSNSDKFKISKKGTLFISAFVLYRKLMNLPKGG